MSLPRYTSTGDMKGFGFVEFETEEGALTACQVMSVYDKNTAAYI